MPGIKFHILLFLLIGSSTIASAQKKPNIVFILADDLGYGDLGCYGQKMIKTPNLDALCANGMRFTNYYSGSSVCAPSRETMLTGMHTGHTFIRGNFLTDEKEDPPMPDNKITIPEYLKKAGYKTALIGKWGMGGEKHGPEKQGFDYTYGYLDQIHAHDYYPSYLYETGRKFNIEANKDSAHGAYSHDLIFEKTMEYLNKAGSEQPFYLYLPYTLPHGAYTLPPDTPYTTTGWSKQFQVYATMISKLDKNIGQILALLKEKGLADNTVIMFASDNGANMGFAQFFKSNGILSGSKFGLSEGGIRVPLIACWPGKIKAGQVSDHITASWDVLPSICNMAGIPVPAGIDGVSFLPELMNKKQADHEYLYWEYFNYNYNWDKPSGNKIPRNWVESIALRIGKWKLVKKNMLKNKMAPLELYDLDTDPGEKTDVAKEHPDIIKKAEGILLKCRVPDPPYFPYDKMKTL
ncbi:MAG: arylsulfatase [Chitinophagaceae bacterium]